MKQRIFLSKWRQRIWERWHRTIQIRSANPIAKNDEQNERHGNLRIPISRWSFHWWNPQRISTPQQQNRQHIALRQLKIGAGHVPAYRFEPLEWISARRGARARQGQASFWAEFRRAWGHIQMVCVFGWGEWDDSSYLLPACLLLPSAGAWSLPVIFVFTNVIVMSSAWTVFSFTSFLAQAQAQPQPQPITCFRKTVLLLLGKLDAYRVSLGSVETGLFYFGWQSHNILLS
jgi:hypothetical protein